jgi:hypothetical protein
MNLSCKSTQPDFSIVPEIEVSQHWALAQQDLSKCLLSLVSCTKAESREQRITFTRPACTSTTDNDAML